MPCHPEGLREPAQEGWEHDRVFVYGIQECWELEFGDGVRGGIDLPADELAGETPGDAFIGVVGPKVSRDAVTGQPLEEALVRVARSLELEYFKNKELWVKVFRSEAMAQTGKRPIRFKCVDRNKGDDLDLSYRARLVAMEIRRAGEDPIFAQMLQ